MKLRDLDRLPDRDLIAELRAMIQGLSGDEAVFGLAVADTTAMTNKVNLFETKVDMVDTKRVEKTAAVGARDTERDALTDLVRPNMKTMRNEVGNDSGKLGLVNLDPYDTTATSADAPGSVPFALIDFGILRHTINFRDSATPDKRAKPPGVLGCEIFSKVGGPAPVEDSEFTMITLDTSTPHIIQYPMSDAGKTIWYRMRWVTKSGEKGGWSETVEATVNG